MPVVSFDVKGAGKVVDANAKINAAIKKGNRDLATELVKANRKQLVDESKTAAEKVKISKASFRLIRGAERQAAGERKRELQQSVAAQAGAARVVERVGKQNATTQETLNRKIRETTVAFKTAGGSPVLLKKEIGRLKKKYEGAETAQNSAFGGASIQRLATYALGFASVHKALALVTTEIKKQQDLIDRQVATKLSVSESRNLVLRNLSSKTPAEQQAALAASRRIAEERGISEVAINAGFAEALSASGGKIKPSIAAVELAARNLADRPGEIGMAAGAILDIGKVTVSEDVRAGFGLLTKVGELGRVVSPRQQAKNIAPALIGLKSFGFSGREAGALFASLSSAGGDVTGERTGTAGVQIGKKLSTFDVGDNQSEREAIQKKIERTKVLIARQRGKSTEKLSVDARQARRNRIEDLQSSLREDLALSAGLAAAPKLALPKGFAGFSGGEKIAALQANPALARLFLSDFGGEAKVLGPIQDLLLRPESIAAKEFANNLRLIPDNAGLIKFSEKALGVFQQNKLEPVAQLDRALNSAVETLRLDQPLSLSKEQREKFKEILVATGSSALGATAVDFLIGATDGGRGLTAESLRSSVRDRIRQIKTPNLLGFQNPALVNRSGFDPSSGPGLTETDERQIKALERLNQLLDKAFGQEDTGRKIDRTNELLEEAVTNGGLQGVAG